MNVQGILDVIVLSLATTSISVTIAKSDMFLSFRGWMSGLGDWFGGLVSCSYCLSHWVAAVFVLIYRPVVIEGFFVIGMIVSIFSIVTISAILGGVIIKMKNFGAHAVTKNTVSGQ